MSMEKTRIFDNCRPRVPAGQKISVQVAQTLKKGTTDLLSVIGNDKVTLMTGGPQTRLTPADIAGVYPAEGSTDSPDEFLPHIALTRRTLPWERVGPGGSGWLALLLLKQSEMAGPAGGAGASIGPAAIASIAARDGVAYGRLRTQSKLADDASVEIAYIPHSLLQTILPSKQEVALLSHLKQVERGTPPANTSVDTAVVVCNRLPTAGDGTQPPQLHTALLVSLEHRDDLFDGSRFSPQNLNASAALLVLHHWRFTPSTGGDFEQVMQSIAIRPNGGVLRFGNVPRVPATGTPPPLSGPFDALLDSDGYVRDPLPHMQPGNPEYRGPLRPFAPPPRSRGIAVRATPEEFANAPVGSGLDYSHAAAFELGRLLALGNMELVEDLHEVRRTYPEIKIVEVNTLPTILQKPSWVMTPEPFWNMGPDSLVKPQAELEALGVGDITGIRALAPAWENSVIAQLGPAAAPGPAAVNQLDLASLTEDVLEQLAPAMVNLKV